MKCEKCGQENAEHVAYCGWCGESVRESEPLAQDNPGRSISPPDTAYSVPLSRSHIQKTPIDARLRSVATVTALISVVLFITAIALFVWYYELVIDFQSNIHYNPDFDNLELMNNVARAGTYTSMVGLVGMVLTISLVIQGIMKRQRLGLSLVYMMPASLSRARYLIILALAFVVSAFGLRLTLTEVRLDLGSEWLLRLVGLTAHLQWAAWVCVSLVLFIVARQIRCMRESLH